MNEYDLIRSIAGRFRRSAQQRNALFECDAECLSIGGETWAISIDEFSAEEDGFDAGRPRELGASLAAAVLSDLFAAGAAPGFFLQALSLPPEPDPAFVAALCDGMAATLDRAGCALCGGDLGSSPSWRCTGVALGPIATATGAPLTRRVPPAREQALWITGALGACNAAAFARLPPPPLALRVEEAALLRRHACAAIDTSGGLADALWLMHTTSPGVRIEVDLDAIPYAPSVLPVCTAGGIPAEAALIGGAGEYELLFTTDVPLPPGVPAQFARLGTIRLGAVHPAPAGASLVFLRPGRPPLPMRQPPPCPRAAASHAVHAAEAIAAARALLDGRG